MIPQLPGWCVPAKNGGAFASHRRPLNGPRPTRGVIGHSRFCRTLGSGLLAPKMIVAAMQNPEKKVCAHQPRERHCAARRLNYTVASPTGARSGAEAAGHPGSGAGELAGARRSTIPGVGAALGVTGHDDVRGWTGPAYSFTENPWRTEAPASAACQATWKTAPPYCRN